jgi:hypothetical protein
VEEGFALLREIDLTVINRCRRRIEPPDKREFLFGKQVEFVPKRRFLTFLFPGIVLTLGALCSTTMGFVSRCMTEVSGDDRCVLNDPALFPISLFTQLPLEFLPTRTKFPIDRH